MMQAETLVVGGGLSGLALAVQLTKAGHDFHLIEARDRLGGRIMTDAIGGARFDLGPAWFWPGQPRIAALIEQLGLTAFEQHSDGALLFEDDHGNVHQGRGQGSMQGALRLRGGFGALIDALGKQLPPERLHLSAPVTALTQDDRGVIAQTAAGQTIRAARVVLALPPRIAAGLSFTPVLPDAAFAAMAHTATWMAGQAKAIAIYDRPFWRDAGLSGDAMSRLGPMVELHDASPETGGPYAIFGFIGVPAQARTDVQVLRDQVQAQLQRLFGAAAAAPVKLVIKDWAQDPFTATQLDSQPLTAHPRYGMPQALENMWDGRLLFSGTEVASQFGGYIEGALEAAEHSLRLTRAVP